MIGDKLIINDYHREAAAMIFNALKDKLVKEGPPLAVTVAGESGCGKSETAWVLAELCADAGYKPIILQQDDYFVLPPKTNHNRRLQGIDWVGTGEVRLDTLTRNIDDVKSGVKKEITKPLVIFEEDRITEEQVDVSDVKVVIAEGTYTTLLKNADLRAFINRDYRQTKKARLARSRDPATDFLEKVLAIEHEIISGHREMADVIIPPPADEAATVVRKNSSKIKN